MSEYSVISGLSGGVLIGLSSVLLLAASGRIAGISGILGGLYGKWNEVDALWRIIFLAGLVFGAGLVALINNGLNIHQQVDAPYLIFAGLLVGFGTRMGSGCTSGHGVCGIARRSIRSIFATVTFITVAMTVVYLIRHQLA